MGTDVYHADSAVMLVKRGAEVWRAFAYGLMSAQMIRQAVKDLNRVREIAVVAGKYGFVDLLQRTKLFELVGRKDAGAPAETPRESTARRFRGLLNDLGPTFVKMGQILSTRPDILPAEYIDELSKLQDAVPPIEMSEVRAQIETALGQKLESLFAWVDEKPLASASIAQVHRARTLDGAEVVVKVQRPKIAERIRADIDILYYLARLLEAVIEETGVYTPVGIVEEFERAITEELDFVHEASNVREFYERFQTFPNLVVPRVYDALSSRTVLTLEHLDGVKITDAQLSPEQKKKFARDIIDASFRQLFEYGIFHGDPHPGNILVLPSDRLGLLDFGLVGRVTKQMQENLVMLVLAIALRDADTVARLLYRIATPGHRTELQVFRSDIETILQRYLGNTATLSQIEARTLLRDLLDLAVKHRIKVPKDYAILSRSAVAAEGLVRRLDPDLNVLEVALPYAKELLWGRYDLQAMSGGVMRTLLRMQSVANDLPSQLSQILLDLEAGKFSIQMHSEEVDRLNATVRSLGAICLMGLLACGFIVGAFMSFSRYPVEYRGVPVLGVLAIAAATGLFGAALTWSLLAGRFRKIRLRDWIRPNKRSKR
jgi:ubiquinone biosynthesis protein